MGGQSFSLIMLWDGTGRCYFHLFSPHGAVSSWQRRPSCVPVLPYMQPIEQHHLPCQSRSVSDPWCVVTRSYTTKGVWSYLRTNILPREFDTGLEEAL